jgi:NADPH:quinone reductase-like Zn-dependent oxidoreductase
MRAYELKPIQSLDSLTLVERPDPRPGPGQVLLEMRAWSLNFRDLSVARVPTAVHRPLGDSAF